MSAVLTLPDGRITGEAGRRANVTRPLTHPLDLGEEGLAMHATRICSVSSCESKHHAYGFCSLHAARFKKNGDPLIVGDHYPGRSRLERPGYHAAHKRVSRALGKASDRLCVDCGKPAHEWSYNGGSPNEITGDVSGSVVSWSSDIADYSPRCRPCHRRMDNSLNRERDELGRFRPVDEVIL